MTKSENIIIFKNDAVGDLVQSRDAIYNIIKKNSENKVILYLSERSKEFWFLFDYENVEIKIISYDLTLFEKIKIFYDLFRKHIKKIYILTPKNFYYFLPIIFINIKFYALVINSINNYQRPSAFLRKFLFKYVINDRATKSKRFSTMQIQRNLTKENGDNHNFNLKKMPNFKKRELINIDDYIYFHLKKSNFDKLGWGENELMMIFEEFLKYNKNIVFTKDIEKLDEISNYKKNFNMIDFSTDKKILNNSNIYLCDNIIGSDLFHIINNSNKVVAFHGMMTNLASINQKNVLDLFYCKIDSITDYRRYKNALYEFIPRYKRYDLIVPSKDIKKTIRKMKFFLKK